MKKLWTLIIVLLAVFTLAACTDDPDNPDPDPDPDPTENNGELIDFSESYTQKESITVWMDDDSGDYMDELISEFNKLYPNIVVNFEHKGSVDSRELLKTFGPSGNGADVFQFPHDHLAQAVLEDLVYPLPESTQELLEDRTAEIAMNIATLSYDETAQSFDPNSPNAVERLYAVPISLESIGLFYNTDLIDTPAATFEELLTAADAWNSAQASDGSGLTNAESGNYYLATSSHWADSYFMQPIYSAFGFYPFGENLDDPSEVGFESTEAINALNWINTELKPRVTGNGNTDSVTGGANFESGDAPYIIAGPWNIEGYSNAEGLNYSIAPMPTINGNAASTFAGAQMVAVYKYSEHKEAAIKWVEFLNTDTAMEIMYEYKTKLPALKTDLLDDIEGVSDDTLLLAMSAQLQSSVPMPTIPQVTYYWGPGETMIKQIWNNGEAVAVAAEEAETSYETSVNLAG